MRKLKFKVIVYEYVEDRINKKIYYYEEKYDDNIKLGKIVDNICEKFDKNNEIHRPTIMGLNCLLWSKYFKNVNYEGNLVDERTSIEYFKYKIGDLCKQFEIAKQEIVILINPPIGGVVGRKNGIHYFFHTNESDLHHKPHIHVKSGDIIFRIGLEDLKILDSKTFKNPKKTKMAVEMVRINQKGLINYWNKVVVNGETIKFKMYFPY